MPRRNATPPPTRKGAPRATKRQKALAWFFVALMVFSVLAGLGSLMATP